MSGRTLSEAIELLCFAVGKDKVRHYDGGGSIWIGAHDGVPDAVFIDWGLAESTAMILNAVVDGELIPRG